MVKQPPLKIMKTKMSNSKRYRTRKYTGSRKVSSGVQKALASPNPRIALKALRSLNKGPVGANTLNQPSRRNAKELIQALRLTQERQKLTQEISSLQVRLMQSNRAIETLLQKSGGRPYLTKAGIKHWTAEPTVVGSGNEPSQAPVKRGRGRPRKIRPEEIGQAYQVSFQKPSTKRKYRTRSIGKLKTGRRGKVKTQILRLLSKSGPMKVKDIAKAINKKQGDVFTWFSITGRTTPGIKKVSRGTYSFNSKKLFAKA